MMFLVHLFFPAFQELPYLEVLTFSFLFYSFQLKLTVMINFKTMLLFLIGINTFNCDGVRLIQQH